MIKPNALKIGDVVGVIAPSDVVDKNELISASKIVKKWGLAVRFGKYVFAQVGDFMAGTAQERQEDLRTMIYDPEVKVIWAASGGYAATEVLSVLDRETINYLKKNPKWFVGYSDICLILNALSSFNIISLTGPGMWGLSEWDKYSQEMVRKILFGEKVFGIEPSAKWTAGVDGVAEGKVLYNNLETLIDSFGTRFDPIMYGQGDLILVVEELDVNKSTLQRQIDIIFNHKRANRIKGFVMGRMINVNEMSYPKWGRKLSPQDVVLGRIKDYKIPMAFCDDLGHGAWDYPPFANFKKYFYNRRFLSLANGIKAQLTVSQKECKLEYLEAICQPSELLELLPKN